MGNHFLMNEMSCVKTALGVFLHKFIYALAICVAGGCIFLIKFLFNKCSSDCSDSSNGSDGSDDSNSSILMKEEKQKISDVADDKYNGYDNEYIANEKKHL